jgi:transcriptional regulator NrdR family protein
MRCTSCNEPTRVLETRQRPDGAIRRRRECSDCGRRFTTGEIPEHSDWLGELPEVVHGPDGGGPLEAVRRQAILASVRDENDRQLRAAIDELRKIADELSDILDRAGARDAEEAKEAKA